MAVVVDPDNLDRDQIIFGTNTQKVSIYPVGAKVHASASASIAYTSNGTLNFHDKTGGFVTWAVASGDVLVLRNGPDAAHLIVDSVTNASTLVVKADGDFTGFTSTTASTLVYGIYDPSGGSVADGVSKQALYSFGKEEWRTDAYATALSDNLIRHEFPYEAITSEQMEIGGGAAHANWTYFNTYTRKKVRTGGWAEKNFAATASTEYTGIVTLGTLDSDTQVYYQQVSAQNTPVNFTFLGTVNEAIDTYTSAGDDRRSFLKLFARKKGRTFVGSQISDIGVTQIKTIVNRFPLAHINDTAIVATDAQLLGQSPWRAGATVVTDTTGVTSAISSTVAQFRAATGTPFGTSTVCAGDMLYITAAQTDTGYYTVLSVTNASSLKIDTDEAGILTGATSLDYDIFTPIVTASKANNVASSLGDLTTLAGASALVAIVSSNTAVFQTNGVAVGDVLAITSSTSSFAGVYVITSVVSEKRLLVDATDHPFSTTTGNDFKVYAAGMFLEYKKNPITISATGSITFASATQRATRDTGSWSGDGVTVGTILTFASSTSNNQSYTVASVGTTTVGFVALDQTRITNENTAGITTTAADGFKRVINGVTYGFNWKVTGNSGLAAEVYQFVQHQLRQTTDIDWGAGSSRGDVTDLLMSYAAPTGTTTNMIIDDINADDTNNMTYNDATTVARTFPFVSSLTINFNNNLQNDASAVYRMFFTTNPSGNFSTKDAVLVQDASLVEISGNVGGSPSVSKTFDYDGNTQGGRSAAADADVTIVAIGLATAQYVITTGTITRSKGLTFSLVAPLERNYSNP